MIRYRLWVWVLCLVFPTWVWAENETRTCTSFTQQGRQVTFHLADSAALQLQLCSSSVVKIWFSPDGQLQRRNTSFAVINEELEEVGTIHVDEQAACYEIFTPKLRIRVNKSPMSLQIFDKYQKLLFSDYADKGHVSEGTKKVEYKVLRRDEHFFGLGEKAGKMDRRGESYKMWNSDKPCYSVVEDPLYKSIPFFMSNYRYGIFLDNTYKTEFKFGTESRDYYSFEAPNGEMVYYFIFGKDYKEIISQYVGLTGKPIMPPKWALGFAQCRGLLTSEKLSREIAEGYRKRGIPCDIIYQDIGWTEYLQDFEWRKGNYENPKKMLSDLKEMGFKVVVSQDPVIAQANKKQWEEADRLGYFVKDNTNGKSYDMPWPWGGNCGVVDFTLPAVADWWGTYQQKPIDDGISGTTFNRPGFQEMIADIEAGIVKRVIIKDMSRLGRDYLQVGMYTEIFFPEHDVHFIAVNDGVDSNQEDNEFTPFRNIINEWYAKDTSKKIRAVKRSKGMAGEHIGSHPPYGYRKNPENKKEWIVDEEAAEVVREIFRLCVSGYGPTQIANMLTEREILCPTYYALERGEKPRTVLPPHKYAWNGPVVAMILDRVDYLGHTVNFKTHNKSYKCHKKIKHTPDQWKVFEDTHEAIIDKETFEIVQKIRAGKRRPTRMGEMPMFSGLLYCADCGSKLTFHRKADEPAEKHHYICGNYRSNTSNCTMHYIRNVVVERIVLENLKEVIRYVSNYEDEFVRMMMDADVRQKNRELAQKKKKLIELQKRIGELDTIFQRIYEDNITGKLSDERFMKMSKGYEDEQHTLQAEADKIQNELQQEEKKSVDVKRFLAIVKKYTDLTELTPEILREFVDKIIVHAPDKSSGRRLQEIEIIYNHIGEFDHSKVTLWKGNAV